MERLNAVYNPLTGKIGCVLIQAAVSGSTEVAQMFETTDWELSPEPGQVLIGATYAQWQFIADMTPEARVARWNASA